MLSVFLIEPFCAKFVPTNLTFLCFLLFFYVFYAEITKYTK